MLEAVTAIRTKAVVCGEAAHFPCHKHGKYKTAVLSAAVLPPDETFPEAARLTVAYNLQANRYRQATSADDRFPSAQRKPATASNI